MLTRFNLSLSLFLKSPSLLFSAASFPFFFVCGWNYAIHSSTHSDISTSICRALPAWQALLKALGIEPQRRTNQVLALTEFIGKWEGSKGACERMGCSAIIVSFWFQKALRIVKIKQDFILAKNWGKKMAKTKLYVFMGYLVNLEIFFFLEHHCFFCIPS